MPYLITKAFFISSIFPVLIITMVFDGQVNIINVMSSRSVYLAHHENIPI